MYINLVFLQIICHFWTAARTRTFIVNYIVTRLMFILSLNTSIGNSTYYLIYCQQSNK